MCAYFQSKKASTVRQSKVSSQAKRICQGLRNEASGATLRRTGRAVKAGVSYGPK